MFVLVVLVLDRSWRSILGKDANFTTRVAGDLIIGSRSSPKATTLATDRSRFFEQKRSIIGAFGRSPPFQCFV
jgi:hypothetical protein